MTSGDIAKIKEKHQSVFKNIYSVCDAETGKQIIFACGEDDLRKQLGLKTDDELHGFVLDVKEGRNAKYKVKLNYLDISDPFAPNASTISLGEKLLSKQEASVALNLPSQTSFTNRLSFPRDGFLCHAKRQSSISLPHTLAL